MKSMKSILIDITTHIVMFILHWHYKYFGKDIYYIRGTDKDYGKYMLYTEKVETAERMREF